MQHIMPPPADRLAYVIGPYQEPIAKVEAGEAFGAVRGGRGDDVVNGGAGNDVANGGAGNDLVQGEDGNPNQMTYAFGIDGLEPGTDVTEICFGISLTDHSPSTARRELRRVLSRHAEAPTWPLLDLLQSAASFIMESPQTHSASPRRGVIVASRNQNPLTVWRKDG